MKKYKIWMVNDNDPSDVTELSIRPEHKLMATLEFWEKKKSEDCTLRWEEIVE